VVVASQACFCFGPGALRISSLHDLISGQASILLLSFCIASERAAKVMSAALGSDLILRVEAPQSSRLMIRFSSSIVL
jgi:hypothetical protein